MLDLSLSMEFGNTLLNSFLISVFTLVNVVGLFTITGVSFYLMKWITKVLIK